MREEREKERATRVKAKGKFPEPIPLPQELYVKELSALKVLNSKYFDYQKRQEEKSK